MVLKAAPACSTSGRAAPPRVAATSLRSGAAHGLPPIIGPGGFLFGDGLDALEIDPNCTANCNGGNGGLLWGNGGDGAFGGTGGNAGLLFGNGGNGGNGTQAVLDDEGNVVSAATPGGNGGRGSFFFGNGGNGGNGADAVYEGGLRVSPATAGSDGGDGGNGALFFGNGGNGGDGGWDDQRDSGEITVIDATSGAGGAGGSAAFFGGNGGIGGAGGFAFVRKWERLRRRRRRRR